MELEELTYLDVDIILGTFAIGNQKEMVDLSEIKFNGYTSLAQKKPAKWPRPSYLAFIV